MSQALQMLQRQHDFVFKEILALSQPDPLYDEADEIDDHECSACGGNCSPEDCSEYD